MPRWHINVTGSCLQQMALDILNGNAVRCPDNVSGFIAIIMDVCNEPVVVALGKMLIMRNITIFANILERLFLYEGTAFVLCCFATKSGIYVALAEVGHLDTSMDDQWDVIHRPLKQDITLVVGKLLVVFQSFPQVVFRVVFIGLRTVSFAVSHRVGLYNSEAITLTFDTVVVSTVIFECVVHYVNAIAMMPIVNFKIAHRPNPLGMRLTGF